MNHPGTYIPPKFPTVFFVEIKYPIEIEEGTAMIRTWTCGASISEALKQWRHDNPAVTDSEATCMAGDRKKYYSKNLGLRERRTGHHPSIAA